MEGIAPGGTMFSSYSPPCRNQLLPTLSLITDYLNPYLSYFWNWVQRPFDTLLHRHIPTTLLAISSHHRWPRPRICSHPPWPSLPRQGFGGGIRKPVCLKKPLVRAVQVSKRTFGWNDPPLSGCVQSRVILRHSSTQNHATSMWYSVVWGVIIERRLEVKALAHLV